MLRYGRKGWKTGGSRRGILISALLAAALLLCAVSAAAGTVPETDTSRGGTLTVTMRYTDATTDGSPVQKLSGVTVKLAQVASLSVEDGQAVYTAVEPFTPAEVDYDGMTATEQAAAAKELAALADSDDYTAVTTGSDGKAVFSGLAQGIYLVTQDSGANDAYDLDAMAPMLVAVPYPQEDSDGNVTWKYDVSMYPKTELIKTTADGSITVTKQLWDSSAGLVIYPPEGTELVFYVGLFTDEACTGRASGTSDMPVRFSGSGVSSVTFTGLEIGKTYYVAETDGSGNVVTSLLKDTVLYSPEYPDGQTVTLTPSQKDGTLTFHNTTPELPQGYYYGSELQITKMTVLESGSEWVTGGTYYAGIFADAAYTELITGPLALEMGDSSSVSVTTPVYIGTSADDKVTLYVTETDENGTPLTNDGSNGFIITLSADGGAVDLDPSILTGAFTITNTFPEETEIESESEIETETETETSKQTETPGQSESTKPKTGDETPIAEWILAMVLAAAAFVLLTAQRMRKRK